MPSFYTEHRLIVTLTLVILALGILCFLFIHHEDFMGVGSPALPTVGQQVIIPKVDMTGWKTYRSEKHGFEFEYPGDLFLDIASPETLSSDSNKLQTLLFRGQARNGDLDISLVDKKFDINHLENFGPATWDPNSLHKVIVGNKVGYQRVYTTESNYGGCGSSVTYIDLSKSTFSTFMIDFYECDEPTHPHIYDDAQLITQILSTFKFISPTSTSVIPIACTEEAKQCPDGSYVSRTGPSCAFAACPSVSGSSTALTTRKGTLSGTVSVGPICPVERVGVPCPVPSEAYTSREVIVYAANGTTVVARRNFNPDGTYSFSLSAGNYVVNTPSSGVGGSKDLPKSITVKNGETTTLNFSIDTGIR